MAPSILNPTPASALETNISNCATSYNYRRQPQSTATASSSAVLAGNDPATGSTATNSMARTRAATIGADIPEGSEAQRNQAPGQNGTTKGMAHQLPSIRFLAHQDPRATRPSLAFQQMARILPTGTETIKVGRYSEKDTQPSAAANVPSAAPVGFKSKVVGPSSFKLCDLSWSNCSLPVTVCRSMLAYLAL
ncbi:hypothetical protein M7I_4038 [Glarea lozoyensis 74030]|uniref:Uncharacterized protein n=1 Tax=Glarea lozoyensis (strain ATCC 74030 / MF5533) TaxID=1104152 RepID=H0EN35_GLAL7|nr:hypothetical protein M7I_4038 [Glarea lozoyensis 74030]